MSDANHERRIPDARRTTTFDMDDKIHARVEADLADALDAIVDAGGYDSRSDAIRDLLRRGLAAHPSSDRGQQRDGDGR